MAEWLGKDPIAMVNAISQFSAREARVRAAHDHTPPTASLPATRGFVAPVVAQESVSAPSKTIHNRPVAVDAMRRK